MLFKKYQKKITRALGLAVLGSLLALNISSLSTIQAEESMEDDCVYVSGSLRIYRDGPSGACLYLIDVECSYGSETRHIGDC